MKRGFFQLSLGVVVLFAVLVVAPAALAGEHGNELSKEMLMNKDRVIVYLDHTPEHVKYLPEDYAVALATYIKHEKMYAFGPDLWLLERVQFTLNMYLLDVRLNKLLHSPTLAPEGYGYERKPHADQGEKGGAYVNTAEVTAHGPLDTVVYDDDQAKVKPMHPSIRIEKSPDKQRVVAGKVVEFEVVVTNTGDVPLKAVRVMDPQVTDCERSIGKLAPGESVRYYCEAVVTGDFKNVATVTGYDLNGGAVVDADDAYVDAINPSIKIEKTPDLQRVVAGKPVTFSITVTNTGDVPLRHVEVTDPNAPDCERVIDFLDVLESISYDCVVVVGQAQDNDNLDKKHGHPGKYDEADHRYGELVLTENFASWLVCQLHQDLASYDAKGTGLLVDACKQDDDGGWFYQVWKAN